MPSSLVRTFTDPGGHPASLQNAVLGFNTAFAARLNSIGRPPGSWSCSCCDQLQMAEEREDLAGSIEGLRLRDD